MRPRLLVEFKNENLINAWKFSAQINLGVRQNLEHLIIKILLLRQYLSRLSYVKKKVLPMKHVLLFQTSQDIPMVTPSNGPRSLTCV